MPAIWCTMTDHSENERPLWLRRPIVLVGMMGAGKTSVGQKLAVRLDLPFHDADAEIERVTGLTIREIFAQHGEAFFRQDERRTIMRLLRMVPGVLAIGGGAFVDPEIRAAIAESGVSIWLRCQLPTLVQRTSTRLDRPLLQNDNPAEVLDRLITKRQAFYAESNIIIDNDREEIDLTIESVLLALAAYGVPEVLPGVACMFGRNLHTM